MAAAFSNGVQVQKIAAFREFASNIAAQVVEQLCIEYEREVSVMYQDLVSYRNELGRVAELLGHQLGREKQLHEMLEAAHIHSSSVHNASQQVAQQAADSKPIHAMVDQINQQTTQIVATMSQGMSQAHSVAQTHAMTAKQLQEPLINAENEFNRICSMLDQPMISLSSPQPTSAPMPKINIGQQRPATPPKSPPSIPRAAFASGYAGSIAGVRRPSSPGPAAVAEKMRMQRLYAA